MNGSLLFWLWSMSLMFAAGSLAVMTVLILLRLLRGFTNRRRSARRQEIITLFMTASETGDGLARALDPLTRYRRTMAQAFLEYSTLVRGSDFDVIVEALRTAGMENRLLSLSKALNREDRAIAIEALGYIGGPETPGTLRCFLRRSAHMQLKVAAAGALLRLGERPDIDSLLSSFDFHEASAPAELTSVLAEIAQNDADAVMLRLRSGKDSVPVRAMMVEVLGKTGRYDYIDEFTELAQSPEVSVRSAAIDAVGRLALPEARVVLESAIEDPSADVRAEAAEAIARIALPDLINALENRLQDYEWDVRFRAANALASLGEAGRQRLIEAASSDNSRASRAAAMVLAEKRAA